MERFLAILLKAKAGYTRKLAAYPMLIVFVLSVGGMGMFHALGDVIPWTILAFSAAVFCSVVFYFFPNRRLRVPCLVVLPLLSAWRCELQDELMKQDRLHRMAGEVWSPVVLEAIVEATPRWRPDLVQFRDAPDAEQLTDDGKWETSLEMRVVAIRDGKRWLHSESFGRIVVTTKGRIRSRLPGDRVRCFLDWQLIGRPTNPGQFDVAEKNRRQGIGVRGRTDTAAQIEFLDTESTMRIDRWLAWMVVQADIAFHRYVAFGQANLASALVLGQREQVEWAMQESLLATGTIHMLAISGMHIEMVAVSVFYACLALNIGRRTTLLTTMLIVVAYSLLCGGNPPVARAAIVVVVLGVCRWIGKNTNALNLLGLAGVVILLYRPSYWLEIGTQLSFLAVMILILWQRNLPASGTKQALDLLIEQSHPPWRRWLSFGFRWCREILHSSFWVWWLTAPLVLFRFHVVSPIAVILNLVLWIPLLLSLLSGLLLLGLGWLGPWIGYPLGWICGVNLAITDWVVRSADRVSMGHAWLPAPTLHWLLVFYLGLFGMLLFGFGKQVRRLLLAASLLWMVVAVGPAYLAKSGFIQQAAATRGDELSVTFIDVGHGTSVLIRTPSGKVWMYDAGRLGNAQRSFQGIADVLWHERFVKLDGLFLSHADADHFNAITGLSKRFKIDRLITPAATLEASGDGVHEMLRQVRSVGVPIELLNEGNVIDEASVTFSILHPPPEGVKGSDNANSLCLAIEYAGHRILLPGDLEKVGMERLTAKPAREATLLMAPHHGSLSESPAKLLEWCHPRFVVVSGGTRARNPEVRRAFEGEDRTVLVTALDHAVRFHFRAGGEVGLETWQHPGWVANTTISLEMTE